MAAAFRGTGAMGWGEHDPCLFWGTEWFFRTGYRAYLPDWIAALDGVQAKLRGRRPGGRRRLRSRGVGRGDGGRLPELPVLRVRLPPALDRHRRTRAEQAGVTGRATFEVAAATATPGGST